MKKRIWKSLPSVKATLTTIVACLVVGALAAGLHPKALLGLAFAALLLLLLTIRNYDPNGFDKARHRKPSTRTR